MKKLFFLALVAAGAKLVYELVQSQRTTALQPASAPYEPAPSPVATPEATSENVAKPTMNTPITSVDDLTRVTGVGPVYADRLNDLGITGFTALRDVNTAKLAESLGLSESTVADWQSQAGDLGA